MCKNLFSGKGGGFLEGILGLGAGLLIPGVGALIGPELGIGATAADAVAGAGIEGSLSALEGKNPLLGAVEGAVGGGIEGSGILKDIGGDIQNALGFGGDSASGALQPGASSNFSDLGSQNLGGFENTVPSTSVGVATPIAPESVDSITQQNIQNALTNPAPGISQLSDAGSDGIGGFENAPDIGKSAESLSSGDISSGASGGYEAGGGFSPSTSISSPITPSYGNSGSGLAQFTGTNDYTGGGGIQASTGVSPVDNSSSFLKSLSNPSFGQVAGIGNLAYQALQGPAKLPAADAALQSQANELQGTGQNLLNEFNAGAINPAQQAQLDQLRQQGLNQIYQQFASQGVTNPKGDSRFLAAVQQLDQSIEAQKAQMLGAEFQQGTAAEGQASGELENIAQQQLKQQEDYNNQIEEATKSLFNLFGGGSGEKSNG